MQGMLFTELVYADKSEWWHHCYCRWCHHALLHRVYCSLYKQFTELVNAEYTVDGEDNYRCTHTYWRVV